VENKDKCEFKWILKFQKSKQIVRRVRRKKSQVLSGRAIKLKKV
jgi:hypothetical protein